MRIEKYGISIIFALLLLSRVGLAQGGENSLVVKVANSDGRPFKHACVTFVPQEGEIIFRKTDRSGKVILKKLLPGNYRVIVKVDGYGADKQEVAVSESGQDLLLFTLLPRNR